MASFKKLTATGSVFSGRCRFHGFVLGTDSTNDPTITIEDRAGAGGQNAGEIIPTCTYDATALGLNGATGLPPEGVLCDNGIYVTISVAGGGAVEVTIFYS